MNCGRNWDESNPVYADRKSAMAKEFPARLSVRGLKNIRVKESEKNFTFIVGSRSY
jgi:hypothetical protein